MTIGGNECFFVFIGFMGYAPEIHSLVSHHKVEDTDDDQLYYTKLFLDKDIRVSACLYSVVSSQGGGGIPLYV